MIRRKRFQNRVSESQWLMPLTWVVCVVVWWLFHAWTTANVVGFCCFILSVYVVSLWSVRYNLLRNNSSMLPSLFGLLMLLLSMYIEGWRPYIVVCCICCSLLILFRCHGSWRVAGRVYFALLFLGVGSLFFFPLLFFIPLFWLLMKLAFHCLDVRTCVASLLGVLTPYWLCFPLLFVAKVANMETCNAFADSFGLTDCCGVCAQTNGILLWKVFSVIGFLLFSVFFGVVHYLRQGYADKSFIRFTYYMFMLFSAVCVIMGVVVWLFKFSFQLHRGDGFSILGLLLALFISPLLAHFWAHTYTRWTNALFKFWIVMFVGLLVMSA